MNLIEAHKLKAEINGSSVLEEVDFRLPTKSFLCVTGPNGAGKSILVKCLLGLISPAEGEVSILGKKPNKLPASEIGYVPQFKTYDKSFPAQVMDLVVSGISHNWPVWISRSEKKEANEALEKVHAQHLARRQLGTLSGGELQKIYLARALIQKRRLIILDEPNTGIDSFGEADLYGLLEHELTENQTSIIMVTHDLEVARHHSTHVLLLNRRQISFGSPNVALEQDQLNRAFGHSEHQHKGHTHA